MNFSYVSKRKLVVLGALFLLSFFFFSFEKAKASFDHLVINEIQTGGASASDEFVRMYNPTSGNLDISGWKIQYKSATGTSWYTKGTVPVGTVISSKAFFLFGTANIENPDNPMNSGLSATGGHIRLINANVRLIDLVGYGTADSAEGGSPAPAPKANQSIKRRIDGDDTENNASDFIINSPENSNAIPIIQENADLGGVYLNELMPDPATPKTDLNDEWIELFNSNNHSVDLSGAILRDTVGTVHEFIIPKGTEVGPGGYAVFYSSATDISLNNDGDMIEFLDKSRNIIDKTPNYGKAKTGLSYALFEEGWDWTRNPSPMAENSFLSAEEETTKASKEKKSAEKAEKKTISKKTVKPSKTSTGVKGSQKGKDSAQNENLPLISNSSNLLSKNLGFFLIFIGAILGINYLIFREKIYEFYHKKLGRNN
ncbi:MAG: lamin tail domain-containing protein [Patescibacteria group bacterium]|nr:lamin tail domain-containing protein [Patescibacteria group bacterium]MCL5093666.1 lamin tail domain-containing protein [Patescibacteria group bacterium]